MSAAITAADIQLGSNVDTTKDFYLKPDGTGKLDLVRGVVGAPVSTVLTINADGSITGPFLGSGQTWQDVTASRALGVTYTNSTNKPILVVFLGAVNATYAVTVAGLTVTQWIQSNTQIPCTFIVQAGATYSIAGAGGTVGKWAELR